jgi:hypothetical protein
VVRQVDPGDLERADAVGAGEVLDGEQLAQARLRLQRVDEVGHVG